MMQLVCGGRGRDWMVLGIGLLMLLAGRAAAVTASYTGPIDSEHNRQFFADIKGKPVTHLRIRSSGGEVEAGITLGRWVYANRLDVEVVDYCLSSCANYVFPAARHKRITKGAVVAWHGNYHHLQHTGLWRNDIAVRMRKNGEDTDTARRHVQQQMIRLVKLEQDFFHQIGVNQRVCWIGKLPPYKVPNYYFLSGKDMARFGISNVEIPPDYAQTDVSGFTDHIEYIRLPDQYLPR